MVGLDPRQLVPDLARGNPADDGLTLKLDRALAPITQLNMDVGKQVVTGIHHYARCREFVHDRHRATIVQWLLYAKPTLSAWLPGQTAAS